MDEMDDSVKQMVSFMMGKGDVSLFDSIRAPVVEPIREEIRKEFETLLKEKEARIAALEARLNKEKGDNGMPSSTKIETLEQQNKDLRTEAYDHGTEGKYHGRNNMTPADEADVNDEEIPESIFLHPFHVRRVFYKLKDGSVEALEITNLFDKIFKLEHLWNREGINAEERRRRRGLYIAHLLNEIKDKLETLSKVLEKDTEPDLLRAVNYALKEYPCLLRYMEDGNLAFCNNICEQQMRRIAIYRNNSFFMGSIDSAKRFARINSHVQSSTLCKKNTMRNIQDLLNKVGNTIKDEYAGLLPNRWVDPIIIPLVY